jgi:taurine dioxygenase
MQAPRDYELPGGLKVSRIQPAIGARVLGIDLARPLTPAKAADLRSALFAHGVIFLTGQAHIGFDQHIALSEVFGKPILDGPDPARPHITPVRARAGSREGTASTWHSDGCYMAAPPAVSVLRAIEPCLFGGDTCYASAVAAYAGLSDDDKALITSLRFRSSLAERMPKNYGHFGSADKWEELNTKYPPVFQPLVTVHPVTGARALYCNTTWSLSIEGMDAAAGDALIKRLAAEFLRPEYQMRWTWEAGAIAIWDNRLVQHYGVPDQTGDRYLERITVEGGPMLGLADWEAREGVAA